ncbi:MAG TPA: class I SAM-dependent methyltransferase [Capsulimonadaceae bacterium]|nr:class I SAM-dependent methyltransferase [Capsulimonadaceae bacterium]
MDEVARYNTERWKALDEVEAVFTRPNLDQTAESAARYVNKGGRLGDLAGKDVLCLASGGGQQSAAFGLLGANVTVVDLSPAQLAKDKLIAEHYKLPIKTVQGDMRDLSALEADSFDVVFHPHSLDFVPDEGVVFEQVARVLRAGGIYYFDCTNPFYAGGSEEDWNGEGYLRKHPYRASQMIEVPDSDWTYDRSKHPGANVPPTRIYTRSFSQMINNLFDLGFTLFHVDDWHAVQPDPDADPGTFAHFVSVTPPWMSYWLRYAPERS